MKKLIKSSILCLLVIVTIAYQYGCAKKSSDPVSPSTNDPQSSKIKSDQAYQMMENEMDKAVNGNYTNASSYDQINIGGANALYKEALNTNAGNMDAQFGAAISEIMCAYSDADINQLVKDLEQSFNDYGLGKIISRPIIPAKASQMIVPLEILAGNLFALNKIALKDPPLINRIQQVLSDKFLPRINYAIDRLNIIESHPDFEFIISSKMQGDLQLNPVRVYITEAEFINAGLQGVKAALEIFLIYNFDLPNYEQSTLINALNQNNTTFFVLKSDGQQRVASIKNDFNSMLTKAKSAINYLESVSGKKNDAIIKLGSGNVQQKDLDSVKKYLNMAYNSLTQNVSVKLNNADTDGNSYTVNINIGNYLNNLPNNPKKNLLPSYSITSVGTGKFDIKFSFDAQSYADFNFPDPTFCGLFPGMSNETLKRILQIDKEYGFELYGWLDNGMFYGSQSSYSLSLSTSAKTYTLNSDSYGSLYILIRDATTVPSNISKIELNYDGEKIGLSQINTNYEPLTITAKKYANCDIIVRSPKNLVVTSEKTNSRIKVAWLENDQNTSQYGYYTIYKKTNSGSFIKIVDNTYFGSLVYYDKSVTSGNTYTYRVEQGIDSYYTSSNWSHVLYPTVKRSTSEVAVSY